MRVAHFIQRYPPALGGSEAYFARLSRYLVSSGDRVDVFTSNAVALEAFWSAGACVPAGVSVEEGVCVRRYPLWRMPARRYVLKALSLVPHPLWQCLTLPCNPISWGLWVDAGRLQDGFDAVHASAFPYAWPIANAWRLARRLGVPFLLTPFLHLGDPTTAGDRTRRRYTARALRWLLLQADAVFVQTPSERAACLELGVAEGRVHLQGLGVDPDECTGGDRQDARSAWGVGADEVVVGHLANQSEEKGSVDLVRALVPLWREGRPVQLVLAGPEMPNFRRFWSEFRQDGAAVRVRRLAVLSEEQKRDFFAGIDLFALPSRSDSFGLVLLEAWANGKPNVAYRAGGPAELLDHEEDGMLVPCGDVPALSACLRRLIEDGEMRSRLGRNGQNRVGREFRWEDKLELVRSVQHDLMEKRSDRPAQRTLPTS